MSSISINLTEFDAFVQTVLAEEGVPGCAIAAVNSSETLLARGFGLRDLTRQLPVTPESLFGIASTTKAFTTAAMALLVDRGLLEWDAPLRLYMPDFELFDPQASSHMTPRDLVCHRSGLPRHDFMWYGSPFSRQELIERLRFIEPNRDFRSLYQYQNMMFMAAGCLVERISGLTWEEFMQREFFGPLGMAHTNCSVDASRLAADVAHPCRKQHDRVEQIDFLNVDALGPAGSLNSSVADLSRWVQLHLNHGRVGQHQLVSATNLEETHRPVISVPGAFYSVMARSTEAGPNAYALGWHVLTYRGQKLVYHTGGIDGYASLVSFMPDANLGTAVLCNLDESDVPYVLTLDLYDRLLGLAPVDWAGRFRSAGQRAARAAQGARENFARLRRAGTHPAHALAEYAGEYEHPAYGVFSIWLEGEALSAHYNSFDFKSEHYHFETFEFSNEEIGKHLVLTFQPDSRGQVDTFSVSFEPAVAEIVFTRRPDPALGRAETLRTLAGEYLLEDGQVVAVDWRGGDTLTLTLPGEFAVPLRPYGEPRGERLFRSLDYPLMYAGFEKDGTLTISLPTEYYRAARRS